MSLTESTMLELGTVAPGITLTDAVTGKTVHRDEVRGQKALLVMFICAHCPYVKHIEKGLAALGKDYAGKPLAIVAISSNDATTHPADSPAGLTARPAISSNDPTPPPADSPAGLKQQGETCGFVFPYLYDETQAVAHA